MAAPTRDKVVRRANALLEHVGLAHRMTSLSQCDANLFSLLYETLTGSKPTGGVGSSVQHCQAVVDALARQLSPHVSLEHICGADLAEGDTLCLTNLLDIFSVLFHLPSTSEDENTLLSVSAGDYTTLVPHPPPSPPSDLTKPSELVPEELGSTDSTKELLRSLLEPHPLFYQPCPLLNTSLLSDDASPSPQGTTPTLSITTLTNSTPSPPPLTDSTPSPFTDGRRRDEEGGPSPSLSTPAPPHPSQRRLLRSPLHHSTPHTLTRSRVFKPHPHPLPSSHPTTHPPPLPKASLLPLLESQKKATVYVHEEEEEEEEEGEKDEEENEGTDFEEEEEEEEETEEEGGEDEARLVSSTVATQTEADILTSSSFPSSLPLVELSPTVSSPDQSVRNEDHQESTTKSTSAKDLNHECTRVHFSPHTQNRATRLVPSRTAMERKQRGGGGGGQTGGRRVKPGARRQAGGGNVSGKRKGDKNKDMRTEVLASLYEGYLREVRATHTPSQPPPELRREKGQRRRPLPPSTAGGGRDQRQEKERSSDGKRENNKDIHNLLEEVSPEEDILPLVMSALPSCQVSPHTLRRLWKRQLQQITTITRHTTTQHKPDSRVCDMERRHTTLLEAIRKDLSHTRRLQQLQQSKAEQQAVRSRLQAKRHASARAHRYYNNYELRLKAKMQKKRTKEEQIFRNAFEDGLNILKDRARELRKFTAEKRQQQNKQQQQHLEGLHRYYSEQFSMLAEALAREKEEVVIRDKARRRLAQQLRRELYQKMESEIQDLQESLNRDDEAAHFRQLDADQLTHSLHTLPLRTYTSSTVIL